MMRDLDPAKTSSNYAYEIRNLRITAQEDTTLLALVSEKGNLQYTVTGDVLSGKVLGYCLLNKYLVLFTHTEQTIIDNPETKDGTPSSNEVSVDKIYRLEMNGNTMDSVLLYSGNLGLGDPNVKIETLGVFENESLQKVYWIDGVHQPRSINIMASNVERTKWNNNSFDFSIHLKMNETVTVRKVEYSGMFNSGTIQYILTYYNKNGQQSAAFYQSPINYISHKEKGGQPDETIDNAFSITITNPDTDCDYIRIYSVFRSSENGTPVCKKVADLKTSEVHEDRNEIIKFTGVSLGTETAENYKNTTTAASYMYVLNSSYEEVDIENFLLYRSGRQSIYEISSSYIIFLVSKSNGTISAVRAPSGENLSIWISTGGGAIGINKTGTTKLRIWANVSASTNTKYVNVPYIKYIDNGLSNEVVSYSEILYAGGTEIIPSCMEQKNNTLFFGNYRSSSIERNAIDTIANHSMINFGYADIKISKGEFGSYHMYNNQLDMDAKQITTFKGGETYCFGIILQNESGVWTEVIPIGSARNPLYPYDLPTNSFRPVKAYIYFDSVAKAIISKYKAIKVVRLDSPNTVVCQGVICPTVYNKKRESNSPYCQSSWFFRYLSPTSGFASRKIQNIHDGNIREGALDLRDTDLEIAEIQGASLNSIGYYSGETPPSDLNDTDIFVDWNTLTLHSPDIEFGDVSNFNYKMRIVGIVPLTSVRTSMHYTCGLPVSSSVSGTGHDAYNPIIHNHLSVNAYESDLSAYAYRDGPTGNVSSGDWLYPIYPWHANRSLTAESAPSEGNEWHALLETKAMATLRESAMTLYKQGPIYDITRVSTYQDDEVPLIIEEDVENVTFPNAKMYMGSVDTILTSEYDCYGIRDNTNARTIARLSLTTNKEPIRMKYKSTKHGVFSLKSARNFLYIPPNVTLSSGSSSSQDGYLSNIKPAGIINGIVTFTTALSSDNAYVLTGVQDANSFASENILLLNKSGSTLHNRLCYVIESVGTTALKVKMLDEEWFSMHTNGDKIGYNEDSIQSEHATIENTISYYYYFVYNTNNSRQYYRTLIVDIKTINIIDSTTINHSFTVSPVTLAGQIDESSTMQIYQDTYDISDIDQSGYSYMYAVELYTNDIDVDYNNRSWYVASEPQKTNRNCIEASIGDTYYQKYDCLKTYPYSLEDQNQIVEILSFMCETRINIDGRYDSRRGMSDNTSVLSSNFNLLNKGYTQNDNFFTYYYLDPEDFTTDRFPNQIIWTGTKVYGSDVDAWTQILPTSTLDMNGSLGEIRALKLWNDNLICFQDMGIAKIMYNERTTMTTEQGVPVEIANSGKVDGSHYISNSIGCSNKDSIQVTPEGIYFVDSKKRELYKWAQGFDPISKSKGFNSYFNDNYVSIDTIKTFYDPKLRDVYFRIEKLNGQGQVNDSLTECLVYNEQLGEFTSFFDYDMDYMFLFNDSIVSIEHDSSNLWKQFAGSEYLRYFGRMQTNNGQQTQYYQDYSIEFISAEHPTEDKIFTNVEFRADVLGGQITTSSQATQDSYNKQPFKTMQVWNEYQSTGEVPFVYGMTGNLIQKFRMWRAIIGRDIADKTHKLNRIRSPWARTRLVGGGDNRKTVIHDVAISYT